MPGVHAFEPQDGSSIRESKPDSQEEDFARLLESYESALASGRPLTPVGTLPVPPELKGRLTKAVDCLRMLQAHWPPVIPDTTTKVGENPADHSTAFQVSVPPKAIGRFEVLRELGRGGMGVVYLARQPELNRLVALKMVLSGVFASESELARFRTEATAAAQLQHPNIVQLFEIGEAEGQPFLVFEYLEGGSLARYLGGRPQSPRAAAELVRALALAIEHAHRRGVVHRDLKPANVLFSSVPRRFKGGTGRFDFALGNCHVKIADLGLAKRIGVDVTQSGMAFGTSCYMAPEQASGQLRSIGPATDIYGLGATLYELLTGRPPFRGESVVETLDQVRNQEPVAPRRLQAGLPADLQTICLKCLEKEPRKRYSSAEALAEDLERWLAGEPIRARRVGRVERTWRWCRRKPVLSALCATVFLLVLTLVTGLAVSAALINSALKTAEDERDKSKMQEELTQIQKNMVRRNLYIAEMRLANDAWRAVDRAHLRDLLARQIPAPGEEDLRGFEWYYLRRLCNKELMTLTGHEGEVYHVTFSPDGQTLATASQDQTIKLWDANTGKMLDSFDGHKGDVNWVTFSPDGKLLASAGDDGTIRVRDISSRKELKKFAAHNGEAVAVEFTPDGRMIISGGQDGVIRTWDWTTGPLPITFAGNFLAKVEALQISKDGKTLGVVCGHGLTLYRIPTWPITGATVVQPLAQNTFSNVPSVGIASFHKQPAVAVTLTDGAVVQWQYDQQVPLKHDRRHIGSAMCAAISPDDQWLATGGADRSVRMRNLQSLETNTAIGHSGKIWGIAFAPSGGRVASASADHTVKIWSPYSVLDRKILSRQVGYVNALSFSPDSKSLAAVSEDGMARLWNVSTASLGAELKMPGRPVSANGPPGQRHESALLSAAFAPDGKAIAIGGLGLGGLWEPHAGNRFTPVAGRPGAYTGMTFSPDGKTLAGCGPNFASPRTEAAVSLLNSSGPYEPRKATVMGLSTGKLAYSPDGQILVHSSFGMAEVWNSAMTNRLGHVSTGRGATNCLRFSPDGKVLVTGSEDGRLKFWDVATMTQRCSVLAHGGKQIYDAAFSADGKTIATGGGDNTLRLWNVATGQELFVLDSAFKGNYRAVAFSPDGKSLAAAAEFGGKKGEEYLWLTASREDVPETADK